MKKTLFLLLAAFVCLALVACGSDKKEETPAVTDGTPVATEGTPAATEGTPAATEGTPVAPTNNKVQEFVDNYGKEFLDGFKEGFESSGLTCTADLKAEGNGIVITVCINEIEDATADMKKEMQDAYDADPTAFNEALATIQGEFPEVEYMKVEVCEKDGDLLATIKAGK